MKIAIPYNNGEVFAHFGKAEHFKIYTVNDEEVTSSELITPGSGGHDVLADFLKENNINMIICGGIGVGAVTALKEAGIQIMGGASGEADKRVEDFLNGQLHFDQAGASCCGNHGCSHGNHECSHGDGSAEEEECDGNISACRGKEAVYDK